MVLLHIYYKFTLPIYTISSRYMTMVNVPERVSGIVTDDSIPLKGCEKTIVPSSVSYSMPQNENWLPHENLCPSIWRVIGGAR